MFISGGAQLSRPSLVLTVSMCDVYAAMHIQTSKHARLGGVGGMLPQENF